MTISHIYRNVCCCQRFYIPKSLKINVLRVFILLLLPIYNEIILHEMSKSVKQWWIKNYINYIKTRAILLTGG